MELASAVHHRSSPMPTAPPTINGGDTAWVLISAALVMLMTPALGFFYGGLVNRKNVLSTIMHSFFILALISVVWVLWGYTLAFVAFQMMFAAITPALITGAFAERKRFKAFVLFSLLWSTIVYSPLAHWVWAPTGWIFKMGALDF